MSQMGGVMGDVGQIASNAFSGFVTGGPIGAALGAGTTALAVLTSGIQECVSAASASEAVWASLGAAVERSGQSWQAMKQGTEDALLAMSKLTVYSDEQLAQALERLMTFGLSYDQAMQGLAATIDFAAAKHIDLESAANLVGKALDGNTAALKRYGVDVEVAKDAADKFTPVLAALNDQFGGAAQAAAETYAGTQERLNNAWGEVQEKVGNIVLPALASLTEAMIPVVDSLGKGVDAVSAWVTEVSKMPEVKGFLEDVGGAFSAFGDAIQKGWSYLIEQLTPAINELVSALGDVWEAIQPVFEAFGELWAAITEGSGDFDLFKAIVQAIVIEIRGFAEIIKAAAPYIREFADAFKAAADFIAPILTQMRDAIVGFLDALKNAFQGFHDWLVGGSLWSDLWDRAISILVEAAGELVNKIVSTLIAPITEKLGEFAQAVQTLWTQAWTGLSELFTSLTAAVQGTVTGLFDALNSFLSGAFDNWGPWAMAGMTAISDAVSAGVVTAKGILSGFMDAVQKGWETWTDAIRKTFEAMMKTITDMASQASTTVKGILDGMIGAAQSAATTVSGILASIASGIQGTLNKAGEVAGQAGQTISGAVTGALNTVSNAVTGFYNWLTGHSVWPDMMDQMVAQTQAGMADVRSAFTDAFNSVGYGAPTIPRAALAPATDTAGRLAATERTPLGELQPITITLPVTVTLDGDIIARVTEKRFIAQRRRSRYGTEVA